MKSIELRGLMETSLKGKVAVTLLTVKCLIPRSYSF